MEAMVTSMKIYCGVSRDSIDDILTHGLVIEQYASSTVVIDGRETPCIVAHLVPGDIICDEAHTVISVDIEPFDIMIAEGAYRGTISFPAEQTGAKDVSIAEYERLYTDSLVEAKNYRMGDYAKPECLILKSVCAEKAELIGEYRGFPIVYESSELLYAERAFNDFCEKYGNMRLYSVRCCCEALVNSGRMKKIRVGKNLVFIDKKTGEKIVIPGK